MRRAVYLLGIAVMWAGYIIALLLLRNWSYFKVAALLFVALAIAFGFFTITLLGKAARH